MTPSRIHSVTQAIHLLQHASRRDKNSVSEGLAEGDARREKNDKEAESGMQRQGCRERERERGREKGRGKERERDGEREEEGEKRKTRHEDETKQDSDTQWTRRGHQSQHHASNI